MIYTLSLRDFLTQVYPAASEDGLRQYKAEKATILSRCMSETPFPEDSFLYTTSSASEINVIVETEGKHDEKQEVLVTDVEKEELHPRIVKDLYEALLEVLDAAIHAKKENYTSYSHEELKTILADCYSYARYMERCETDFEWGNEDVPGGLHESMTKNEADIKALEFERSRRDFLGED